MSSTTDEVVAPQRLVLVLPSTGEFDSRTWRIASSAVARGHAVTVVARHRPGLPETEVHPAGYTIIRTPVSAVDGLPLPGPIRDRIRRRREAGRATAVASPPVGGAAPSTDDATGDGAPVARPGLVAWMRRTPAATVRMIAIALTVRAHGAAVRHLAVEADVIHAMAYMGIAVGLRLGRRLGAPVVYDARDIYVDANNLARLPGVFRRVLGRIERRWARSAAARLTVNEPYARVMAERWGVDQPVIVMNCSYRFTPPEPRERRFHRVLDLPDTARVVLYQGGLSRGRGIEQLAEAVPQVADAHLVLLGYGPLAPAWGARAAKPGSRLHLLPAVPPQELLGWVASADVVAMPIQPSTLNHRLTTPNKLFEAIAAGVPVLASDLPGMSGIVAEVGAGSLVDPTDVSAIARAITDLLALPEPDRVAMVARELAAARDRYNWDVQAERLFALYTQLSGRAW